MTTFRKEVPNSAFELNKLIQRGFRKAHCYREFLAQQAGHWRDLVVNSVGKL